MAWFSPEVATVDPVDAAHVRPFLIQPGPSQHRVITSEATVVAACSNMGEGKTWAMIMSTIFHAYRCRNDIEGAVIRDTYENLKATVVKDFKEFFALSQTRHAWHNEYRRLEIFCQYKISLDLFGIDDLAALTKLQGTNAYSLIWLEEPCPYTTSTTVSAGLSEDVYNASLARCVRAQGTKGRLQLSFNPPDEDHWVFHRILAAPDGMINPKTPLITKETIEFKPGENVHLKEEARQGVFAAYAHDPIALARFVRGEPATKYPGKPVVGRLFNPAIHVSPIALEPVEGLMSFVSWDSWSNPAAILGQQWPDGRLWILDECTDGADVRDMVRNAVNPLVQSPRWKDKSYGWRQVGDRTMRQPNQVSDAFGRNECAADVVEKEFDPGMGQNVPFELGPQTWPQLLLGIQHALQQMTRGQPTLLIDPVRCKRLIGGLKGRWHFPVNKAGVPTQLIPLKDESSHPCDCLANAVCVLSPWTALMQQHYLKRRHFPQQRRRQIAASYVTR